jgi:8-oxo-dGTP pyrophosphatase MutT (NUDIX family)
MTIDDTTVDGATVDRLAARVAALVGEVPPTFLADLERFRAEGRAPAPARTAATVLLLRPASPGFEVYVIRRLAAMTFGGRYAFPGGGVDPSDAEGELDWSGPPPQEWGDRLGLPAREARALVCAAVREVFEEAGVLLAGPGPDRVVGDVSGDDWEAARQALVQRRLGFADFLRQRGLTLRSDLLSPWSRWITPEFEPRRFDAYFFVARLPEGQRTRDVSGEADHTMWIRPADALTRALDRQIDMLPPTLVTLAEVATAGDLDGVVRAAATREAARPVQPKLVTDADGAPRFVLD